MKRAPTRALLALAGLAVVAAVVTAVAVARPAAHPMLIGTVGKNNAYKITLMTSAGNLVKTLKPGTYTVLIHDDSSHHNYELDGPNGKSWTFTSVPFKGTKTFTLKFVAGKYKAYCAPHEPIMFQHFTVSASGTSGSATGGGGGGGGSYG
jgi:plastocyanin